MGLRYSTAHPRVIKVAPLQSKEEEIPSDKPGNCTVNSNLEAKSPYFVTRTQDSNNAFKGQLPPLRETWYGRSSAVPRTMYFDLPLEQGETSIIKRHPPRRLQKLQPIDLPPLVTSGSFLQQQESWRVKGLDKKMIIPMYVSGKRQYLHKMQMLEINRKRQEAQVELKKSLQRDTGINKQKLRDHKAKKILPKTPRNDGDDLLTLLPDETVNRNSGNLQNTEFWELPAKNDYSPRKIGKMETWLREQEARGTLLWDSSSSDSDELGNDKEKSRALVRTRTERIPLFDDFFDRD